MREISLDRLRTWSPSPTWARFANAARALAPPTINLHVADLEAQVGAALLTRTRGQVRPPPSARPCWPAPAACWPTPARRWTTCSARSRGWRAA